MKLLKNDDTFIISDEELIHSAEKVIEFSKLNTVDSTIGIFQNISLPFSGQNYKRQLFEKIFELANINYKWDNDLGFIILSENRTKKTVVSHMDLIPSFNKGFKNGKVYKITDGKLIGALDNTFTNAIVINSILNKQSKETSYLFTLDEETTQYSIRDYMKRFGKEQFIINLDVTNDGFDYNMSVEYDEPCWNICKQINENLDNPFFTTERVGDDLDNVLKANGFGFSYCLPTNKKIHSYNNYTKLNKIQPYMDGLEFLIHEMDTSLICQDIDYLTIDKALKYKSFKKMKDKDVFSRPKFNYEEEENEVEDYNSSFGISNNPKNNDKKINKLYKFITDYATYKNYASKKDIVDFTENTLLSYDFFTLDELTYYVSENFFYDALNMKFIISTYQQFYDFDIDFTSSSEFKIYEVLRKYKNIDRIAFFELIIDENINELSYEEIISLEKDQKAQNINEAVNELITKGLIKKEKNNDMFKILKN